MKRKSLSVEGIENRAKSLARNAAAKAYPVIVAKFQDQVVFPADPPESCKAYFTVTCSIHGKMKTSINNLRNNYFACPDCGTKRVVLVDGKKQCSVCKEWKPLNQYSKTGKLLKSGQPKLEARCKACSVKQRTQHANTERGKELARKANEKYKVSKGIVPGKKVENISVCKCEHCEKLFTRKGTVIKRFCSPVCGRAFNKMSSIGKTKKRSEKEYKCKTCGCSFIGKHPGKCIECASAAYKSAHKAHKKKRRAALRTVAIHAVVDTKVFAWDKWKCRNCGCKVQKVDIYAANAAELDHIVPISLGGPHSYSNVQTLCRKCNQDKSNNYNGQLVLYV